MSIASVGNAAALVGKVPSGQSYITSFAVSWVDPAGGSPAATAPITMTILDHAIKPGDTIYELTRHGLEGVGVARVSGSASVRFTTDPDLVVAGVPRIARVASIGVERGASVQVDLSCAAGVRCRGRGTLTAEETARRGTKRAVVVADGVFVLDGGHGRLVTFATTRAGRSLLGAWGRRGLTASLVVTLVGGARSVHRVVLR